MDTRDTPEQAELRRSARRLARDLGPANVADLEVATRSRRLADAVREAGWLTLRDDDGEGLPLASGVEAAIVAEALGACVADVAFAGPILAADLARRAGASDAERAAVAFEPSLEGAAIVSGSATSAPLHAIDDGRGDLDLARAYVLVPEDGGWRIGVVSLPRDGDGDAGARADREARSGGADLTRSVCAIPPGTPVHLLPSQRRLLDAADLARWTALGLALGSADLVGVMRGVLDVAVDYVSQRKQFGVAVGSFQAVQHLLAEARCLMEGSQSVAAHASWAIDELEPAEARMAGRVAKAYCARAARTVCETAVQVHGGIGNAWECIVHVYLRRALLSSQWFGDDGVQLQELQRERLGVDVGFP